MSKLIIKLIPVIVMVSFGISCQKERNTSFSLVKVLVNKTDKVLLFSIQADVLNDSIYSYGNDSIAMTFVKKGNTSLPIIGPYNIDIDNVYIVKEVVYNLSDTTSFEFNQNRLQWNRSDSIFWDNIILETEGTTFDENHIETLYYSSQMKDIMSKNYSMLNIFSVYYKR